MLALVIYENISFMSKYFLWLILPYFPKPKAKPNAQVLQKEAREREQGTERGREREEEEREEREGKKEWNKKSFLVSRHLFFMFRDQLNTVTVIKYSWLSALVKYFCVL